MRYRPVVRCLSCTTALATERHEGVELDRCPGCHAVFFDAGELTSVVGERVDSVLAQSARGRKPAAEAPGCPRCSGPMLAVPLAEPSLPSELRSGRTVLRCSRCAGVWVDGGLARVLTARRAPVQGSSFTQSGWSTPADEKREHTVKTVFEVLEHVWLLWPWT